MILSFKVDDDDNNHQAAATAYGSGQFVSQEPFSSTAPGTSFWSSASAASAKLTASLATLSTPKLIGLVLGVVLALAVAGACVGAGYIATPTGEI